MKQKHRQVENQSFQLSRKSIHDCGFLQEASQLVCKTQKHLDQRAKDPRLPNEIQKKQKKPKVLRQLFVWDKKQILDSFLAKIIQKTEIKQNPEYKYRKRFLGQYTGYFYWHDVDGGFLEKLDKKPFCWHQRMPDPARRPPLTPIWYK
jgi:hypothetical protein